jgi:hypothetical protein
MKGARIPYLEVGADVETPRRSRINVHSRRGAERHHYLASLHG